jgi:tRNA-splicing ligase RtcB
MVAIINGGAVPIRSWAPPHEVDSDVIRQLQNVARLPWVAHHVAVMPDVHLGRGATVGSVIAMRGAVCPAAVGVDIGYGMAAVRTNITASDLPDSLRELREHVESVIPVGRDRHTAPAWNSVGAALRARGAELLNGFDALHGPVKGLGSTVSEQLGSLGGGNHFLEVCLDTDENVWLMLHSGSRRVGAALAEHHMAVAQRLQHNRQLPDRDLAVFLSGTAEFSAYRHDLLWAQDYARLNRDVMLALFQKAMRRHFPHITFEAAVTCHHNYVAEEMHFDEELVVTRKGAIRGGAGELGIIPGSMGTRSFIVRGLGNALSFQSASHGAGRRMSRTDAKKRFTVQDLRQQTAGVECRKDAGVIDEAPKAYKDIGRVMDQQKDLVEIVAELKQVMCVKG